MSVGMPINDHQGLGDPREEGGKVVDPEPEGGVVPKVETDGLASETQGDPAPAPKAETAPAGRRSCVFSLEAVRNWRSASAGQTALMPPCRTYAWKPRSLRI